MRRGRLLLPTLVAALLLLLVAGVLVLRRQVGGGDGDGSGDGAGRRTQHEAAVLLEQQQLQQVAAANNNDNNAHGDSVYDNSDLRADETLPRTLPSGTPIHDLVHAGLSGFDVPPLLKAADLTDAACVDLLHSRHAVWPRNLERHWRQLHVLVLGIDLANIKRRAQTMGGPAGELVFFGDLVLSLLCSGHRVVLVDHLGELDGADLAVFDAFFTERNWIGTMAVFERLGVIERFPCRARLMDFFGMSLSTVPQPLSVRQIVTPYPYRTGNDFLGIVIRNRPGTAAAAAAAGGTNNGKQPQERENCGVLWGKEPKYFEHAHVMAVLNALNFTRLVATINKNLLQHAQGLVLPPHIDNRGTIDRAEFIGLMRTCAFLLGVGDPVMGPTALEAVANGAAFLNPVRHDPPFSLNREDPHIFQHAYLARVGEPYVYNIDLFKLDDVVATVKHVLRTPLQAPHPLKEFTLPSMAERVLANILNPEVCPISLRLELPSEGLIV